MGKNKKVKPNGFTEFMFEFISKEKNAGRFHKREDFSAVAAPYWEKLSSHEREVYQKRAKDKSGCGSFGNRKSSPPKFTSHGILISEMERAAAEQVDRQRKALQRINHIVVSNYLDGVLAKTEFNFIMANYFVQTTRGQYYPAELALIKFNFTDGLIQKYHQYMNPQTLPTGYAYEALEHAKVHRLKVPPHAMGETRFEKVYDDLLKFLNDGNVDRKSSIPVFVHENHMKMIKSILSQLPELPDAVERDIDVLSLNTLFNELKNVDAPDQQTRISIHVSNMLLDADRYDSAQNIACTYHEEEDAALQCAMSICRRWFFTFCDHVCAEKLNVPLVAGVHLPDNSDVNVQPSTKFDEEKMNPVSLRTNGAARFFTRSLKHECDRDAPSKSGYNNGCFGRNNPFADADREKSQWQGIGRQSGRYRSNYH